MQPSTFALVKHVILSLRIPYEKGHKSLTWEPLNGHEGAMLDIRINHYRVGTAIVCAAEVLTNIQASALVEAAASKLPQASVVAADMATLCESVRAMVRADKDELDAVRGLRNLMHGMTKILLEHDGEWLLRFHTDN